MTETLPEYRVDRPVSYLGIDFSLASTGYALVSVNGGAITRTIKTDSKWPLADRLVKIADEIVGFIQENRPAAVAAEAMAHAKFGTSAIGQVHGAAQYAFAKAGISWPVYVHPATLKKFATGSGACDKGDIKLYVFKRWGAEIRSGDEADAYTMARLIGALHGGFPAELEYDKDCLKAVQKLGANVTALRGVAAAR